MKSPILDKKGSFKHIFNTSSNKTKEHFIMVVQLILTINIESLKKNPRKYKGAKKITRKFTLSISTSYFNVLLKCLREILEKLIDIAFTKWRYSEDVIGFKVNLLPWISVGIYKFWQTSIDDLVLPAMCLNKEQQSVSIYSRDTPKMHTK